MQTQVGKWGNSLAVRIPRACAEGLKLAEGMEVDIVVVDGGLLLKRRPRQFTLDELIAGITPENRHEETDWGPPAGGEAW
jgi:antitoxin MazE